MKLFIARQKDPDEAEFLSTEEYIQRRLSYHDMIQRGEPYSFRDRTPLIYVFGPGTFWKLQTPEFLIMGQALDHEDFEDVEDVLYRRRDGDIYGRWFSRYALEGDLGYQSYLRVEPATYQEYVSFIDRLEKQQHDS